MINVFGEEKFRPVKKHGIPVPNYFVSNEGQVYSSFTKKILSPGKSSANCGTKYTVALTVDLKEWEKNGGYIYSSGPNNKDTCMFSVTVHRLVMDAWKSIDEYPPERLSENWDEVITPDMVGQPRIPESYKQWVRDTAIIDHINDDPSDNRVDNLRWCTPIDNSHHRKKREFVSNNGEN